MCQVTQNEADGEKQKNAIWTKMNLRGKWNYFINNITVEPMLACYIMPSVLASLATQNLNLEKACYVNLGYSPEVCQALTARETANYTEQETNVQQLVARMTVWKTIVQSAIPSAMMLFLGSWSDRHSKRKPLMLLPIIGEFLTSMGLIVCTYFFFELPMEVAGVVEALFPAITGGWFTMFMAVFSYIGDVTTLEMRTLRIGVVNLFVSLGVPVGMALSGVLYVKVGFYGIFCISATLYVISFIYGMRRIHEEKKPPPVLEKKRQDQVCGSVRDFFDIQHVVETFRVVFKEGKYDRRRRVIMLMVCCMVIIGPMHGEIAVMYLFTRYRFNWNEVDFSMFSTYSMITNLIGTMVSVGLFSHVLKIDDALIGVMSCTSKILSCFVYAFSTTDWMIYMAPIVEILNGTSFIAMRSIISKLVPPDELGKVNSLFGVCEALMPLVYGPMYSAVYAATMHTVPGAFFLLGGALTMPAVLMFFWMYMVHKREERRIAEEEKEQANDLAPIPNEKANGHIDTASYITADEKKQASESTPPEKPTGKVNEGYTQDPDETA
ncbi:probable peptidoglycan muropeptide transporter SLC46 isoform X2 [Anabrus simplex]|uniref:probable peptidoglycan muropeptide transporter SLC46 isoform X2 n=1 Tax=Anabrus simplex TaxID=316456 RepID=UPI0035A2EC51